MSIKLVIAGSRTITNPHFLTDALKEVSEYTIETIIAGGAYGADTLAKDYALNNNINYIEYKPNYKSNNDRGAPLRRNLIMAEQGDVLLALWDGKSTGTKHMINAMQTLKKPVYICYF